MELIKDKRNIQNLYYYGEKKPHMWWEEFESHLDVEFDNIDINEGGVLYYNVTRLIMIKKERRLISEKVKRLQLSQQ